ncbi:magnesium chelatase domain-containing protein [Embleya sp. AB8]|uniref:magnesium chelatase domain-containing protein n=1 Tax=Embleya sp. AB8 TaxID=3156304 RepID=UPI003C7919CE
MTSTASAGREFVIFGRNQENGYELWDVEPVPTGPERGAYLEELSFEVEEAGGNTATKRAASARDAVDQVLAGLCAERGDTYQLTPTSNVTAYGPISEPPGTARALSGNHTETYLVEAASTPGPAAITVEGVSDRESQAIRDRVRAAVLNSDRVWPDSRLTVTLTPTRPGADRCVSASLDLAIACTVLAAAGLLPAACLTRTALIGELGLDGSIRLPYEARELTDLLRQLRSAGADTVVIPLDALGMNNTGVRTFGARDVSEALSIVHLIDKRCLYVNP